MTHDDDENRDKSDEDDEQFENLWMNWSSRRRCESAHRKDHLENFKKKFNKS
ncbi:MAG: hypothetical protein GF364_08195 [Candidatus Lokiarchaeota archaeon]|nr:hypothetical protein [Candidatus Lokiarchaeota archaeon]